ncbi:MAG TPA: hypothetical protein VE338_01535 [Ktedonobacterales bacterium]|jgi:hypothetical protein|nr:hypothetical protein [Ktedonobacterales bacterium]
MVQQVLIGLGVVSAIAINWFAQVLAGLVAVIDWTAMFASTHAVLVLIALVGGIAVCAGLAYGGYCLYRIARERQGSLPTLGNKR